METPDLTTDLDTPARVLAISAHPDDSELMAGATLAKWAAAGATVNILVCTDGSKGTWDVNADTAALVAQRRREQKAALRALGSEGEAVFGDWVDGELESGLAQRSAVARWIRHFRPDVVIGHDPWKRYRLHPDHRHAGRLAVEGIVAARDPHFFPEHGLPHHRPDELLLFEADIVNHVERVDSWIDTKLESLNAHQSQMESTMYVDADDDGSQLKEFQTRIRQRAQADGALVGVPFGEAFHRMNDL